MAESYGEEREPMSAKGTILALTKAVDSWLAALIVGGIYGLIAGALALTGAMNVRRGVPPTPGRQSRA